jgi:hypothetical protein
LDMRAASDPGGNRSASARQHRASGATSQLTQADTRTARRPSSRRSTVVGARRTTLSRPVGTPSSTAISTTAMERPSSGTEPRRNRCLRTGLMAPRHRCRGDHRRGVSLPGAAASSLSVAVDCSWSAAQRRTDRRWSGLPGGPSPGRGLTADDRSNLRPCCALLARRCRQARQRLASNDHAPAGSDRS